MNMANMNECLRDLNVGLPEDIQRRKLHGDFAGALRLIEQRLADKNTPESLKRCMIVHREIIERLPANFPYTREQALARVREHIPDFTEAEFDHYVDARPIRWIYIDGQEHYIRNFYETLYKTEKNFTQRADAGVNHKGSQSVSLDHCVSKMKSEGSMSCKIEIAASTTVTRDKINELIKSGRLEIAPDGSTKIRAHLPIPAECPQQSEIEILEYTNARTLGVPVTVEIAPENAIQRAICWEVPFAAIQDSPDKQDLTFRVHYAYLHTAYYHDTSKPGPLHDPCDHEKLREFLREEQPHIIFTPYIKALVRELTADLPENTTGNNTLDLNLEKARRFFDFITLNMHYTFMPEYFVLENIPEGCARSFTGDCGVFALLFITLCRCAGVPAAWQSGLTAQPDYCGSHDWARFYTPTHGWLFADPSYGTGSVRLGNEERRRFYFGNLDPWRMVANREFCAPFTLAEHAWRADPYDNQVGEIEFYSVASDGTVKATGLRGREFDFKREILQHKELLTVTA